MPIARLASAKQARRHKGRGAVRALTECSAMRPRDRSAVTGGVLAAETVPARILRGLVDACLRALPGKLASTAD